VIGRCDDPLIGKTTCDALLRTACSQAAASSIGWGKALPGNVDRAPFSNKHGKSVFRSAAVNFVACDASMN